MLLGSLSFCLAEVLFAPRTAGVNENLSLYRDKYTEIDLLLVADRLLNSGRLLQDEEIVVSNPGFRRIYLLSYQEAAGRECSHRTMEKHREYPILH